MRSALIDTNLLLLLIVGLFDKKLIEKHKRTQAFTIADFELLIQCIGGADIIWITTHCLAEVSNLIKQTNQSIKIGLIQFLINVTSKFKESYVSKDLIFVKDCFPRLGVADTGIMIKAKRVDCLFTVDFNLYIEASRNGYKVINFNHLRMKELIS
jgi:hypothetical protein